MKLRTYISAAIICWGVATFAEAQDLSRNVESETSMPESEEVGSAEAMEYGEDIATQEVSEVLELDNKQSRAVQRIHGNTVNYLITSWFAVNQDLNRYEKVYREIQAHRESELQKVLSEEQFQNYLFYKKRDPLIGFRLFDYEDDKFKFALKEKKDKLEVKSEGDPTNFMAYHRMVFPSTYINTNMHAMNYNPDGAVYNNAVDINMRNGLPLGCGYEGSTASMNTHFNNEAYAAYMKGKSPGDLQGNSCERFSKKKQGKKDKSGAQSSLNKKSDNNSAGSETKVREEVYMTRPEANTSDVASVKGKGKEYEVKYKDGSEMKVDGEEVKYKGADGSKLKLEGDEYKSKESDGTVIKHEEGKTKMRK